MNRAAAFCFCGEALFQLRRLDDALDSFERCLEIMRKNEDDAGEMAAKLNMAFLLRHSASTSELQDRVINYYADYLRWTQSTACASQFNFDQRSAMQSHAHACLSELGGDLTMSSLASALSDSNTDLDNDTFTVNTLQDSTEGDVMARGHIMARQAFQGLQQTFDGWDSESSDDDDGEAAAK